MSYHEYEDPSNVTQLEESQNESDTRLKHIELNFVGERKKECFCLSLLVRGQENKFFESAVLTLFRKM